ncbi:MAG: hypothetical protein LBD76_05375 [Prevotellaceae bacterium]|jgi:hypothetical protein|nr:hypothetical protein [Prevotellaceae bacterium]
MKQLILDIQTRLGQAQMPENYPRLRKNNRLFEYVDLDWGQCDYFDRHPVKYPCALIDVNNATYSNTGDLKQIGVISIQIRIIDLVLNNSSYQSPESQKDVAFAIFDLIAETNRLLHGWGQPVSNEKSGYGRLIKQQISKVNRRDGLREYKLLYSVQLTDNTAIPVHEQRKLIPTITAVRVG